MTPDFVKLNKALGLLNQCGFSLGWVTTDHRRILLGDAKGKQPVQDWLNGLSPEQMDLLIKRLTDRAAGEANVETKPPSAKKK